MAAGFKALPSDVEKESESNFFCRIKARDNWGYGKSIS